MKVFVLGCGPSGLLAAHAAILGGHDVEVVSVKRKSPMPGTMHLHDKIPGLTDSEPEFHVNYIKLGDPEVYAMKVYKDNRAPVSFREFDSGLRPSWSMRTMYSELWERYEHLIVNRAVHSDTVVGLMDRCDLLISSIPIQALCHNPFHSFSGRKVWLGDTLPGDLVLPDNTVVYNGLPFWHWYRASLIDGMPALESTKHFPGSYSGVKPLHTDCDCFPNIKRVGRFGQWKKGILVHHAFQQALDHIEEANRSAPNEVY